MSPTLAGRFFTTVPPGNPHRSFLTVVLTFSGNEFKNSRT